MPYGPAAAGLNVPQSAGREKPNFRACSFSSEETKFLDLENEVLSLFEFWASLSSNSVPGILQSRGGSSILRSSVAKAAPCLAYETSCVGRAPDVCQWGRARHGLS